MYDNIGGTLDFNEVQELSALHILELSGNRLQIVFKL